MAPFQALNLCSMIFVETDLALGPASQETIWKSVRVLTATQELMPKCKWERKIKQKNV